MRPRILPSSTLLLLFAASVLCRADEDFKPSRDLSEDGLEAYTLLLSADTYGADCGFDGSPINERNPDSASATLRAEEHGEAAFVRLTKIASAEGKLYGLEGLHRLKSPQFASAAKRLRKDPSPVKFGGGCDGGTHGKLSACVKQLIKRHKAEEKKEETP